MKLFPSQPDVRYVCYVVNQAIIHVFLLVRSASHEALQYLVVSSFVLSRPSWALLSFSALIRCSAYAICLSKCLSSVASARQESFLQIAAQPLAILISIQQSIILKQFVGLRDCSRLMSCINRRLETNVLKTFWGHGTSSKRRFVAREQFSKFNHHESFQSYTVDRFSRNPA
jgi:hypothetical protein